MLKIGGIPVSCRTPEQRAKDLSAAMNWVRHGGTDDQPYDPSGEFCKLNGILPKKRGQTPDGRARELESALDWLRSRIVDDLEDHSLPVMGTCIPFASVATQSPERREKDLHNALNWIRHKRDSMYDPTGEFKRLDSLLPRKRDQSLLDDRARELEGRLDWMRQKCLSPFDESDALIDRSH